VRPTFRCRPSQPPFAVCPEQASPPAAARYLLPPVEVHAGEFAVVGFCDVDVERLALIDESSSVGCHLQDGFLGDLPHCLVELLQVIGNLWDVLK